MKLFRKLVRPSAIPEPAPQQADLNPEPASRPQPGAARVPARVYRISAESCISSPNPVATVSSPDYPEEARWDPVSLIRTTAAQ